jgi:cold shock CspA family protein
VDIFLFLYQFFDSKKRIARTQKKTRKNFQPKKKCFFQKREKVIKKMLQRTNLSLFLARTMPFFVVQGKVASWMPGRGFGFVQDAENKDHFVHYSALKCEPGAFRGLTVGQEVEFDIVTQDGRTRAENVTSVGGGFLPSAPKPFNDGGRGGRGGGGFRGGRGGGRGFGRGGGRGGYNRDGNNNNQQNSAPSDDF